MQTYNPMDATLVGVVVPNFSYDQIGQHRLASDDFFLEVVVLECYDISSSLSPFKPFVLASMFDVVFNTPFVSQKRRINFGQIQAM
jgi:hypothetical protein